MNQFSNDGSFLEQFRKMQQQEPSGGGSVENKHVPGEVTGATSSSSKNVAVKKSGFGSRGPMKGKISIKVGAAKKLPTVQKTTVSDAFGLDDSDEEGGGTATADGPSPGSSNADALKAAEQLAAYVAEGGSTVEAMAIQQNLSNPNFWWLYQTASTPYLRYVSKVLQLSGGRVKPQPPETVIAQQKQQEEQAPSSYDQPRKRRRFEEVPSANTYTTPAPAIAVKTPSASTAQPPASLSASQAVSIVAARLEANKKALQAQVAKQHAMRMEEDQMEQLYPQGPEATDQEALQRQLEEQRYLNSLVERYKQSVSTVPSSSKHRKKKHKMEYDSDEETEGGTWEHKRRLEEMEKTREKAMEQTKAGRGKHHIGDFLPKDEMEKFFQKVKAIKEGAPFDFSDYAEHRITAENLGYQLLKQAGWEEGKGLGSDGSGIVNPINKGKTSFNNEGVGEERPDDIKADDDEFELYRKRMMLAYRFRPNPLNNPRRPYY